MTSRDTSHLRTDDQLEPAAPPPIRDASTFRLCPATGFHRRPGRRVLAKPQRLRIRRIDYIEPVVNLHLLVAFSQLTIKSAQFMEDFCVARFFFERGTQVIEFHEIVASAVTPRAQLQAIFDKGGMIAPVDKNADDARAWLRKEMETWRRDIADAGIKVDE